MKELNQLKELCDVKLVFEYPTKTQYYDVDRIKRYKHLMQEFKKQYDRIIQERPRLLFLGYVNAAEVWLEMLWGY